MRGPGVAVIGSAAFAHPARPCLPAAACSTQAEASSSPDSGRRLACHTHGPLPLHLQDTVQHTQECVVLYGHAFPADTSLCSLPAGSNPIHWPLALAACQAAQKSRIATDQVSVFLPVNPACPGGRFQHIQAVTCLLGVEACAACPLHSFEAAHMAAGGSSTTWRTPFSTSRTPTR